MAKKKQNLSFKQAKKDQQKVNGLANLKDAMAKSMPEADNDEAAKNIATENSEAGAEARAAVVNEVAAKSETATKNEDAGFQGKFKDNPDGSPFQPKGKKGRPLPKKDIAEAAAKAVNAVDLSTPEARHEVAEEVKALGDAIADGLKDEPEEDNTDEVITPENPDAQSDTNGSDIIIDNGDNDPDDTNPAAKGAGGEVINEDAVTNPDALIAVDGEVVSEAAAKPDETQELQEEPALKGDAENGGDEVKETVEITGQAEDTEATTISEDMLINEETTVADLVGTSESPSLEAQPEITPATDENEVAVVVPEPEVNEVAAKSDAPEANLGEAVKDDAVATDATASVQRGLSSSQLDKLDRAWLKKDSQVYKIKPREEIKQMIIEEYAAKSTDSIKNGDVLRRVKKLSVEIYDTAHPKKDKKVVKEVAAKSDSTVIEDTPLSTDVPAVKDPQISSPEITSEAVTENPATTLNGVEEATVAPVEISAKADETSEVINPSSNDETVTVTTIEAVDTTEPEIMAKAVSGETEVPTAPEVLSEVADNNAEGVATGEPEVTPEEIPFDVDVEVAAKVDTAGTVGNSEVAATTDSNSQGEANNSGEGTNVPSEIAAKPESSADAEATDTPVETDATANQDKGTPEITEPATINATPVATADAATTDSAPVNGSPAKTSKAKITHVGDISAMEMLLHSVLVYLFDLDTENTGKNYGAKEGHKMLSKWMKEKGHDPKSTSLDYIQLASKFARENGFCVDEVTGLGFTNDNFRSRVAELFSDKRDTTSSLVNTLMEHISSSYSLKVTIPDNVDDLDLEETRKINRALRVYYDRTFPIIEHIVNIQGNAKFSEHKATKRQFITYREARTEQQAMEISQLKASLQMITAEKGILEAKLVKANESREELAQVAETALTSLDAAEGELLALTEELLTTEGAADTNPKVMSFHKRLLMEHRRWQKRKLLLEQKKNSPLKLLMSKVIVLLLSMYLLPLELRAMRKLVEQEHLAWMQEMIAEQRKVEQQLLLHRQLFTQPKQENQQVYEPIVGYKVYKLLTEDGFEDEYAYEEFELITHNFIDADDRVKLDNLECEAIERWVMAYSNSEKIVINGHGSNREGSSIVHNSVNTNLQWINNPKIANQPVNHMAPVIRDARIKKELPIENAESTNIQEEIKPLSLSPLEMFSLKPDIQQRFLRFNDNIKYDGNDYHVVIVSNEGINEDVLMNVMFKYIKEINKMYSLTVDPLLYLHYTWQLIKAIGTDKYQAVDMFFSLELPYSLAISIATDLANLANCAAIPIQYPKSGNKLALLSIDYPESIASSTLPKFVRDYKGTERYLMRVAAHYAEPYLRQETVDKIQWFITRKEYEYLDGKARPFRGLAAHLNVYHLSELKDIEIPLPEFTRNATSEMFGVTDNGVPLVVEGVTKPSSLIMLNPDNQKAA